MTEKLREQISALADNELSVGEHELLVRRFGADRYLCICWERYHLIGEAMRKALPHVDTRGFAERVMIALGSEPQPSAAPRTSLAARAGKALAGLAVAASVAAVAVIGLHHDTLRNAAGAAPAEVVPPGPGLQPASAGYGLMSNASWNGNSPEVQAELSNYVINHNEMSAGLTRQSMLPYAYIATYNSLRQAPRPPRRTPAIPPPPR